MKRMTYKRFFREFQPILDKNGEIIFFAKTDKLHETTELPEDSHLYVWSLCDCEGSLWLMNGYHCCNNLGYIACKNPYEGEDIYVAW